MAAPPPLNIDYMVKAWFRWLYAALLPGIVFIAGFLLLVYGEVSDVYGASYLTYFLFGTAGALFGLIWLIRVTIREMRRSFKEDKIAQHSKEYMTHKSYARFVWAYAVASVLGLIVAIWTDNDQYLNLFVPIVVLIALLLHYGKKRLEQ